MNRRAPARAVAAALIALAPLPLAAQPPVPEVRVEDGLVTLQPRGATLAEVLAALAERAGFRLVVDGELSTPVEQHFAALPLERAVRRLVAGHTAVVRHRLSDGRPVGIEEVRVYGGPAAGAAAPRGERLEDWIVTQLRRGDSAQRAAAVQRLQELPAATATPLLAEVLAADEDTRVRITAIDALVRIGGAEARQALVEGVEDEDVQVQAAVVRALGGFRSEDSTTLLGQVVSGSPDPEIRAMAVEALAGRRTERARTLIEAALEDPSEAVREAARLSLEGW